MQSQVKPRGGIALVLAVAATLSYAAPPARAQQNSEDVSPGTSRVLVRNDEMQVKLVERFSRILELEKKIKRVDGFDPNVVKVSTLNQQPKRIRVQAVEPGVTTLLLTDEDDRTFTVNVFVAGDVRHLQAYLEKMFPHASVEAMEVEGAVVMRGWVTQPEHISRIVEIAEQFYPRVINHMNVGGVQQVKLNVKVMEVNRSKVRQMGFKFLNFNEDGFAASNPFSTDSPLARILPPSNAPLLNLPGELAESALAPGSAAFGVVGTGQVFNGFVEALRQENLLKVLAKPNLVTTNGRPATILSGGEFPIIVPQSLGTTTIEWREFGVRLEAVPIILGNGRLRLELQPEVSERDFTNSVRVGDTVVPGLTTRRVNTQVEMRFGQTLMIGGLISSRVTAETSKVPVLGELPWIGTAFRRVSYDRSETELVVMVTPEFVAPLDPSQVPPGGPGGFTDAPTDRELFGHGIMEVPRIMHAPAPDSAGQPHPARISPESSATSPSEDAGVPPLSPPSDSGAGEFQLPKPAPPSGSSGPSDLENGLIPPRKPQEIPPSGNGPDGADDAAGGSQSSAKRPGLLKPKPGLLTPSL